MIGKIYLLLAFFFLSFQGFSQTGPAGIGTSTNNVFWLKADKGTSSSTNNTAISTWSDQSGNGIDVTQTVSAQQPSFNTNVINGYPAIQFDNVSTANQNDKLLGIDSPLLDNTSGYSIFTVTRPLSLDNSTARSIVCKRTGVSIDESFMIFYYTSNKLNIDVETTDNRFSTNTTYTNSNNYINTLIYDGTATSASRCAVYVGETFDKYSTETATLVPDNSSPILIGSTDAGDNRPFGGYIAEVIIYRQALGNAERIILHNYLSAKYNIALSANDKYAGDNSGNGDYDRDVAGVGQESTGSNTSFSASVSGGVSMVVNSGFDNGDYIMIGHAVPTNTTITTDVGGMSGSNNARWQRVWYVDVTNTGSNMNINLEFDMSDGGMGTFTLGTLSDYVLLYRAGQTGNWTEVTTASSISGDRVIFSGIAATGDGYMTIGTKNYGASPLPITLTTFTAIPENSSVKLEWSTASEKNNDHFVLERSKDALNFEVFAEKEGSGNSSVLLKYNYEDRNPHPGLSYYRLRQVDLDGSSTCSPIVAVTLNKTEGGLLVFPNPGHGSFKIKLPDPDIDEITVSIKSMNGKELLSGMRLYKSAEGLFNLDLPILLPPGNYMLHFTTVQARYSCKIIVE